MVKTEARYFIIPKSAMHEDRFYIAVQDDYLPLTDFTCFGICYQFTHDSQDYIIVRAAVPPDFIAMILEHISESALDETGSPLTLQALDELGITSVYGGITNQELFAIMQSRFGLDISGERQVGLDEEGNPIFAPYLIPTKIAGEE